MAKFLVCLKDIHNEILAQMTAECPNIADVVMQFPEVMITMSAKEPFIDQLFRDGRVCGVEIQLL